MTEWNLQLFTARLNEKVTRMEAKLTDASDQMDVLETEAERLKEIWESQACREWHIAFATCMKEGRMRISEARRVLLEIADAAERLVILEQNNKKAIEELEI